MTDSPKFSAIVSWAEVDRLERASLDVALDQARLGHDRDVGGLPPSTAVDRTVGSASPAES